MSRENPFISIVMPIYNADKFLEQALISIQKQEFKDYEVIMVDDCSKDRSLDICRVWSEKDPRFKVVHLEQNGGAGPARNIGIDHAAGEYLAFMDADDTIDSELYKQAVDSIQQNSVDQVLWGLTENYYDQAGKIVEQNELCPMEQLCENRQSVLETVIQLEKDTLFGYQWNRLYKLAVIKENQIYFEKSHLYEDYFFNLEVIRHVNSLKIIPFAGYFYNKRENQSLTGQFVKEYFGLSHRRIRTMLEYYQKNDACSTTITNILGNIYLRYILSGLMRNCDKRSDFSFRRRRSWIIKVRNDQLYKNTARSANVDSLVLKLLQMMINAKSAIGCLAIGRIIYIIQTSAPLFFALKKKRKAAHGSN
ncbi:MAG: glycosyltransferase family 2 protein [Lachnospiraceae bacterium]